jgi:alkylation response protein AidB-like acyl-CoA dehydrogenase
MGQAVLIRVRSEATLSAGTSCRMARPPRHRSAGDDTSGPFLKHDALAGNRGTALEFGWSAEQARLGRETIDFARKQLNSEPAEPGGAVPFARESWHRCAQFGIQGLPIPECHGGQGADLVTTALVFESLGYGCSDTGLIFSINAQLWGCTVPIWKFGTTAQQSRYLPSLCNGSLIGALAVTEAESGSDVFAVTTTATSESDHYVISGSKIFVTNAPIADVIVVLARHREEPGVGGLCAFIVDRDTPRVFISEPYPKLGLHSSPMGQVTLDKCRVPASALLGGYGGGMTVFNTTIEWERSFILASVLGSMRRQLEGAIAHARSHRRFGQPIGKNQAVANRIIDMRARLDMARLLLYQLAWLKDQGKRSTIESAIAKLVISESFVQSSDAAFQTFGAQAYMAGSPAERDLRDALASRIHSGTSDIQRMLVARLLGL